MKTKLLSIAFMMSTVCTMWSQDTIANNNWNLEFKNWNFPQDTLDTRPITFPFWMVREIALDLEEKKQLELEAELYALEVETYQKLQESLEEKEQQRRLQLELSAKNILFLETQLQKEKYPKERIVQLVWYLRILGALGAGFIIGRI